MKAKGQPNLVEIGYAYPTSVSAEKFRLKNGGYIVKIVKPQFKVEAISGHEKHADAMAAADATGLEHSRYSKKEDGK